MTTIKDIAKLSGYSIGTVSRVINGRADVSDEARDKIEEIIRRENYHPNANAKMLKQALNSDVAVIVRGVNNLFLESILEEIQIHMRLNGENISVIFIGETEDEVKTAIQVCAKTKPKGLIFLGGSLHSLVEEFSAIDVPAVLVTADASELGFDNLSSFGTDDYNAGYDAAMQLIKNGHRRIGIVGGYPPVFPGDNSSLRMEGAIAAIREAGISFDEDKDFVSCSFSMEAGYQAAKKLLEKENITALFCVSDTVAVGAVRAIHDMGMKVPDDISLIGFDGILYTEYSNPRIATIRQDIKELAVRSVDDLLLRIEYNRPAVHRTIPYQIFTGESIKDINEEREAD